MGESAGIESCGLRIKAELKDFEYPYFDFIVTIFNRYDTNGTLPYPGALVDQPAKIIEIFNILEVLKAEQEEKARIKAEREAKKK